MRVYSIKKQKYKRQNMRSIYAKFLLLFLFFGHSFGLFAQGVSLKEAVQMAIENRWELKNQQLQLQLSQGENDKLRAKWLPQVNASADARWNTQLQTSVFKNAPFANGQDVKLVLGVPFNNTLGLSAEQKIVDATAKYDRQINQANVESQQIALNKLKLDIKFVVIEAYYAALFQAEKMQFAQKTLQRAGNNLEVGKTKFEQGVLLKNDFDRLLLDENLAKSSLANAEQAYILSSKNLKYVIGEKAEQPLVLVETLENLFESVQGNPNVEGQRFEILQEQNALKINELTGQKQQTRLAPIISAYGNYTVLQLNDKFNPFSAGTWFPFNYDGVKLNVPVFDGKQTKLFKNDYAIRTQINKNTIEKLKADIDYEIQSAITSLNQEKMNLTDAKANLALAQQILQTDQLRYEKGTLLSSDLKNTEYSLQTAENNYLTSVYNFLVATVRYQKAVGEE